MPTMSLSEQAFCRSAPWQYLNRRLVVPWALGRAPLEGDVLEIGAGAGSNAEVVAAQAPSARFTVTDVDERMVTAAEQRLRRFGNVTVRAADVTALPFDDATFDVVTSYLMLHHVVAWEAALTEAVRTLRPGGVLRGYDLTRTAVATAVHKADRSPFALLRPAELSEGMLLAGFTDVRVRVARGGLAMRFRGRVPGRQLTGD